MRTRQRHRPALQGQQGVRAPQDCQPLLVIGEVLGALGVRQLHHLHARQKRLREPLLILIATQQPRIHGGAYLKFTCKKPRPGRHLSSARKRVQRGSAAPLPLAPSAAAADGGLCRYSAAYLTCRCALNQWDGCSSFSSSSAGGLPSEPSSICAQVM